MFENLSNKLTDIFSKLTSRGLLTEGDINTAMREVRIALLEADVALPVAKDFINRVKEAATGQEVVKSVEPGQMVVKIVQDELTTLLGSESSELIVDVNPPAVILMIGLQGSGKTTSCAKLAKKLKDNRNKKILLASLDVARPAAQEQLAVLASQVGVESLPIVKGENPIKITERAIKTGELEGYDVVILDTAGRLHIDQDLMKELQKIHKISKPCETLLVADSMTGQDAVNIANHYSEQLDLTGIILTRVDGDSRGGAALSMKAITGQPIKYVGTGEKISEFEEFHPDRMSSRILGMGDIVSLVEKAAEAVDDEEAEELAKKAQKGTFDLNDMLTQFKSIKKMGGMSSILGLIPGLGKFKEKLEGANLDKDVISKQEAIIYSMTKQERKYFKIINGSRKKRIAAGAGVEVQNVNMLLKQFRQMSKMMKKMGKMDKKSLMRSGGMNNLANMLK